MITQLLIVLYSFCLEKGANIRIQINGLTVLDDALAEHLFSAHEDSLQDFEHVGTWF